MFFRTLSTLILSLLLLTACHNSKQTKPINNIPTSPDSLLGEDRDEHGCIPSAGYSWCEAKQKCLRVWEEPCEEKEIDTSSWQLYQNDKLGFTLKFPPSWESFSSHTEEFSTYRYVNFSFTGDHQPFEIFKIMQFSKEEWERINKNISFMILDNNIYPPLVCDGCCREKADISGGGQFDAFQQERCAEVPKILSTFKSVRK